MKCLLLRNPWPGFSSSSSTFAIIFNHPSYLNNSVSVSCLSSYLDLVIGQSFGLGSALIARASSHSCFVLVLYGIVCWVCGFKLYSLFAFCFGGFLTLSSATFLVGRVIFCCDVWICCLVHSLDALSLLLPSIVGVISCCISRSGVLRFCRLPLSILRLLCFVLRSYLWMPFLTDEKASCLSYSFSSWCLDLFCRLFPFILRSLRFVLRSHLWLPILDVSMNRFSFWVVLVLVVCFILQISFLIRVSGQWLGCQW